MKRRRSDEPTPSSSSQSQSTSRVKVRRTTATPLAEVADIEENSSRPRTGWKVQSGMIISVKLTNFMCHQEFTYKPIQRLNFLCGSNGSGKSAILTAVVFALGGTAKNSNRGSSNKSFIRHGQNSATVEITLSNAGETPYRHDLYGDKVTISRTVTSSGGGGYKIKNSSGKIVPMKKMKEEINRMCALWSIQVDNPIAILNQDTAKTFLHSCDPSKLYKFFMRATQMEDIKNDYETAQSEYVAAKDTLDEKVQAVPHMKKKMEEWKKKYEFYQALNGKREGIKQMKKEMSWAMVSQQENEQKKIKDRIELTKKKINKVSKDIESLTSSLKKQKTRKNEVESEIQSIANTINERKNILQGLKSKVTIASNVAGHAERSVKEFERKLKTRINEENALKNELEKIRNSNLEAEYQARREQRQAQLRQYAEQLQDLEAQSHSTSIHISNIDVNIQQSKSQLSQHRNEINILKNKINQKNNEIKSVQRNKNDKISVFGDEILKLVRAIRDSSREFKKPPIGPIGAFMTLKENIDASDAFLVEYETNNFLKSFIVDNFQDKKALQNICNRLRVRTNIITSSFTDRIHDVSSGRVECQFKTIFDVFTFEDPNVANCLIDQKNIETILLINDEKSAQNLLSSRQNVPANCKYALVRSDRNKIVSYYPAPRYRSYVNHMRDGPRMLQSSVEDHLHYLQDELNKLNREMDDSKEKLYEFENGDMKMHVSEKRKAQNKISEITPQIMAINKKISHLKTQEQEEAPPDIAALEEDLEKISEEKQHFEIELDIKKGELNSKKADLDEAQQAYDAKHDEFSTHTQRSNPLSAELTAIEAEIEKIGDDRRYYNGKKETYQTDLPKHDADLKNVEKALEVVLKTALEWSNERVVTDKDPESLRKKIVIAESSLEKQENIHESRTVVIQNYELYMTKYNDLTDSMNTLQRSINRLDGMLKLRTEGYARIRKSVCTKVNNSFITRLAARNYIGNLRFSHSKATLNITVCPEGGNIAHKRSMKTLSGGEKSYSTISLVLALWDSMTPPFRILDEFDVFMDMVNRRIALQLIEKYAKDSRLHQYVFLTPLNTDNIEIDDDISIVRIEKNRG